MRKTHKPTDKEIEEFIKDLDETNTIIWNAICYTEELMRSNVYEAFRNEWGEPILLKRIAKAYKNIKHSDEAFAEPEMNESYFADFEAFTKELQEFLDKNNQ